MQIFFDLNRDGSSHDPCCAALVLARKIFRGSVFVAASCLLLLSFVIPQRDGVSEAHIEGAADYDKGSGDNAAGFAIPVHSPASSADLQQTLEEYGLLTIDDGSTIDPVLFTSFPDNLHTLSITDKKTIFFHALLPIALYANERVAAERHRLEELLAKDESLAADFRLDTMPPAWLKVLSPPDTAWLQALAKRYKAETIAQLKRRVQTVPVSLLLAQSALESSWGTSRFAKEGNNLFGIRTWGSKGLVPDGREAGNTFLVATYDTILDSVRSYIHTLNSHHLYVKFRSLRLESQDPEVLSEGLLFYSENRQSYVTKVKRIIRYNQLKRFDTMQLARYDEGGTGSLATD